MLNLLNTLEAVFQKYIPWHSEAEVKDALSAIAELRNEIQGITPQAEQVVETAEKVVEPDPTPVTAPTEPEAVAEAPVTASIPDIAASAAVTAVEPVHFTEPEIQPFPGSYTPPPAA